MIPLSELIATAKATAQLAEHNDEMWGQESRRAVQFRAIQRLLERIAERPDLHALLEGEPAE
ncbi:hypothetical protein L0F51_00140 [Afifella sp. H1R]|uniref:hypothetical protein n=1 Tax=Afifella sp. H1R TaxID=2908841 RepID=UPI001F2E7FC2|nr:hypothetical protein [Afifella sp. H1R]MCF1502175.1 hypothetical protein [Afifella sp. H1R]